MGTNVCCDITPDGLVGLGMSFEDDFRLKVDLSIGELECVFNDDGYMYSSLGMFGLYRFDVPVVRLSDVEVIVRIFGR